MAKTTFEWDYRKNEVNISKHGISFFEAQRAFLDPNRIIAKDVEHSITEVRYYCFGRVIVILGSRRIRLYRSWRHLLHFVS